MRIFYWVTLLVLPLTAGFFPQTVHTSVTAVSPDKVTLAHPFPVSGMSGVVIHHYGESLDAVTGYIMQPDNSPTAHMLGKGVIHHEQLPTIKTPITKGDKVIGGYLYNNVLLLAPDAESYHTITTQYARTWFHPDLFAAFLSREGEGVPTKENLEAFAKEYQVGLICIVQKDRSVLYDPISHKVVASKPFHYTPQKVHYPFFMRFDSIQTGLFSETGDGNYYKTMEQFK